MTREDIIGDPCTPDVQKLLCGELDRMLDLEVKEESESPWSHPVTLVRKGEKNRLCLDSSKLNVLTTKDAYPLPHIEGLLSRLGDAFYISSIDLKDACIPRYLKPRKDGVHGARKAIVSIHGDGFRLIDKVNPSALRVFVYLDDLLDVSPDFDTPLRLLAKVTSYLKAAGLYINVRKSKFCFRELRY